MGRDLQTYRAARRNLCREQSMVWGENWYFALHKARYARATILKRDASKYHPLADVREAFAKIRDQRITARAAKVAKTILAAGGFGASPLPRGS